MDFQTIRLYHLQKQNLLQKAEASEYQGVLLKHLGLHSTDYLTPYLSLQARVNNFDPKTLFDDINDRRTAARVNGFRSTVFVVHKENLPMVLGASPYVLSNSLKVNINAAKQLGVNLENFKNDVTSILSGNRYLTTSEIKKELPNHWNADQILRAMRVMNLTGVVIRAGQKHISDRLIQYAITEEWIDGLSISELDAEISLQNLVLHYIAVFGPVCLDDISWWLPVTKTVAKMVLEKLDNRITAFAFNDREYFMEKEDFARLNSFHASQYKDPVVNFLPYEDHFAKSYIVRNWHVSEEMYPIVYAKINKTAIGQIRPFIMLNGEAVGRWEMEWADKKKSAMKVMVVNINERSVKTKKLKSLVEKERKDVEKFINRKLVPLMNSRLA